MPYKLKINPVRVPTSYVIRQGQEVAAFTQPDDAVLEAIEQAYNHVGTEVCIETISGQTFEVCEVGDGEVKPESDPQPKPEPDDGGTSEPDLAPDDDQGEAPDARDNPLLPSGITLQVGDYVQFNNPEDGQQYRDWTGGCVAYVGGPKSGLFKAVHPGSGNVFQYHTDGSGPNRAYLKVIADDGTEPMRYDPNGVTEYTRPAEEDEPEPGPDDIGVSHDMDDSDDTPTDVDTGAQPDNGAPADSREFSLAQLGLPEPVQSHAVTLEVTLSDGRRLVSDAPLGLSPLFNADGTPDRWLAAINYGNSLCVENCDMNTPGNWRGRRVVTVDGQVVADDADVHFGRGLRGRPVRFGTQNPMKAVDKARVPHYDPNINPKTYLGEYRKRNNGPNGLSISSQYRMGTTGLRADIGILPGWDVPYINDPSESNAEVVRGASDSAGCWPVHFRDPNTGLPVSIEDHRKASTLGALRGRYGNPIKRKGWYDGKFAPDNAHQTGFSIVALLASGDSYDVEEVAFWGNWPSIEANFGYRKFEKGIVHGSPRKQAWGLRSIAAAATLLPDSYPLKAYFGRILEHNRKHFHSLYVDPGKGKSPFGILTEGNIFPYPGGGMAPWQDDYYTGVVNWIVKLGHADWTGIRDYKAGFALGRMTRMCYQGAALYNLTLKDKNGWLPSFDAVYEQSKLSDWAGKACGTFIPKDDFVSKIGDLSGYPASATGYPAQMQAPLAAAVDADLPRARAAWDHFRSLPTQPSYVGNAAWAIVPERS